MDHLGAGVQVLAVAGKRDARELAVGVIPLQDRRGIQVGDVGAEGAGDPLHPAALLDEGTLGVQVVHVFGPVLDGGVPKARTLSHVELNAPSVEVCHVVLRRGAPLDEVQVCPLIDDDQRVLELACALCVQSKIALQRDVNLHALRDVDERAAGPDRAVEGRKLVVRGRHQVHEGLLHEIRIVPGQGGLHVRVDDAALCDLVLHVVVDELGVVLGADAREGLPLCLRNAELLKGVLDLLRDLVPVSLHVALRAHVGGDAVHIQTVDRRTPVGDLRIVVDFQTLEPEVVHPLRVVLLLGDLLHDVAGQTLLHPEEALRLVVLEVIEASVDFLNVLLF